MDRRYLGCTVIGDILNRPDMELFYGGLRFHYLQHNPEIALAVLESNAFLDEEELVDAAEQGKWERAAYVLYYALTAIHELKLVKKISRAETLTEHDEDAIDQYFRSNFPVQNHVIAIFLNQLYSEAAGLKDEELKKLYDVRAQIAERLKSLFTPIEIMDAISDIYNFDWGQHIISPGITVFDTDSEAAVVASVLKCLINNVY